MASANWNYFWKFTSLFPHIYLLCLKTSVKSSVNNIVFDLMLINLTLEAYPHMAYDCITFIVLSFDVG